MIFILFFLYWPISYAQDLAPEPLNLTFKEGVTFKQGSDFLMRMRFRVQNRFTATTENAEDTTFEQTEFSVRRMRLRFDGYALSPQLLYRLQLSFTRGDQDWDNAQVPNILRDAVVGWQWNPHNTTWVGIAKLPGNRQRVISSSAQQLVDRSLVNAVFNIDRDMGIQHFSEVFENFWVKLALSNGDGRNQPNRNASLASTARAEWYPLGKIP
jgi:phosphate-selective porin OprO and OprP